MEDGDYNPMEYQMQGQQMQGQQQYYQDPAALAAAAANAAFMRHSQLHKKLSFHEQEEMPLPQLQKEA
jgi:hypothetical protein